MWENGPKLKHVHFTIILDHESQQILIFERREQVEI